MIEALSIIGDMVALVLTVVTMGFTAYCFIWFLFGERGPS